MKLNTVERIRSIEKLISTARRTFTIPVLAARYEVAENTIRNDLRILEREGVVCCKNPGSKPEQWGGAQIAKPMAMSLELAFALKQVKQTVQTMLPAELYKEVETVFTAANDTYIAKQKANHHNKVVRFARSTADIDLHRHLALNHLSQPLLETLKSAICKGEEVHLECANGEHVLREISLCELDSRLYICGKTVGFGAKQMRICTAEITAAYSLDASSFGPRGPSAA